MFRQSSVDSSSSSTSLISKFFTHASQNPGVIISGCTVSPSGCHDFGATLKAEFANLDYMSVNFLDKLWGMEIVKEPDAHSKKWENIFITGCLMDYAALIIKSMQGEYDMSGVKHVYVVAPPHLSKGCNDNYVTELEADTASFEKLPYNVSLLTSGIDCKPLHSMGLPRPYPLLESSYKVPEKCFGLMYNRHTECFSKTNGLKYFNAYFAQIALAAKNQHIKSPSVMAIGVNSTIARIILDSEARKYGVKVEYTDRLPQADFLQAMRNLAAKGGLVSCDGAQTLMQAYCLGAKAMFLSDVEQNISFCKQLIAALPDDMRSIASAILDQGESYRMLEDEKQTKKVFEALQSLIQKSVEVFEKNKQLPEAKLSGGMFKQVVMPTKAGAPFPVEAEKSQRLAC